MKSEPVATESHIEQIKQRYPKSSTVKYKWNDTILQGKVFRHGKYKVRMGHKAGRVVPYSSILLDRQGTDRPAKYLDRSLYEKAKKIVDGKHAVHSAYKSMALVKEYRRLGGRIGKGESGTKRWLREDWRNLTPYAFDGVPLEQTPKCGVKGEKQGDRPSVCRPLKSVSRQTPLTADHFTRQQVRDAVAVKERGETIRWGSLKKK